MLLRRLIRSILLENNTPDSVNWGDMLLDRWKDLKDEYAIKNEISKDIGLKRYFYLLGSGAYRRVYGIFGNPYAVLKLSLDPSYGRFMNEQEVRLGKDPLYAGVFPRSYSHHPDFIWFIQERVTDINLPINEWSQRICDYFLPGRLPISRGLDCDETDVEKLFLAMKYARSQVKSDLDLLYLEEDVIDEIKEIHQLLVDEGPPIWHRWSRALVKEDIAINDLRPANLGFSAIKDETGINPPIIHDASIFM